MSEKRTLADALIEFLTIVAKRNGWTPASSSSKVVDIMDTGWIYFRACGVLSFEVGGNVSYNVSFVLTPKSPVLFEVHSLNVYAFDSKPNSPNIKLLQGATVLEHQGRKLAEETTPPEPEDSYKSFLSLWGISRPADLEALFSTYDHVAGLLGAEKIFRL